MQAIGSWLPQRDIVLNSKDAWIKPSWKHLFQRTWLWQTHPWPLSSGTDSVFSDNTKIKEFLYAWCIHEHVQPPSNAWCPHELVQSQATRDVHMNSFSLKQCMMCNCSLSWIPTILQCVCVCSLYLCNFGQSTLKKNKKPGSSSSQWLRIKSGKQLIYYFS